MERLHAEADVDLDRDGGEWLKEHALTVEREGLEGRAIAAAVDAMHLQASDDLRKAVIAHHLGLHVVAIIGARDRRHPNAVRTRAPNRRLSVLDTHPLTAGQVASLDHHVRQRDAGAIAVTAPHGGDNVGHGDGGSDADHGDHNQNFDQREGAHA